MAHLNHDKLVKLHEARGSDATREVLADRSLRQGFDLGRLFEACFGFEEFRTCRKDRTRLVSHVMENAGAVSTAAFTGIIGQIAFSTVLDPYNAEEFVFKNLIPTVPTQFSGEKIPGVTVPGADGQIVEEGKPYPIAGVSQNYIETPATSKRGLIIPITREAIFFDRTGQVIQHAAKVGQALGITQEEEAIDAVIDENRTTHRYNWMGAGPVATYQTSTPWINSKTSNGLTDWTNVNAAEQQLNNMVDPFTGKPIAIKPKHLVVAMEKLHTARRIMSATENRTGNYAVTGNPNMLVAPNTLDPYEILTSRYVAARLATDTDWFLGNIPEAVKYMENWPMQVLQAPTMSHDEFHRDIALQYRADRRGEYAVVEPRYLQKNAA